MLDLYQPCPCHQERKLKFCCGKDVVQQFSKVIDMLEGGQRLKAIQVMDKAIAQHGYRDCLSTIRFASELESGSPAQAAELCEHYVAENGWTSIGWTMRSMIAMEQADLRGAIDHLQSALETLETPSAMTCEAMLSLGVSLARAGGPVAARDHFHLYLKFQPASDSQAANFLQIVRSSMALMPYEKHEWPLVPIPDGRPWSLEAAQALHWAEQGLWRKALRALHPLAEANPAEAVLWKNVAILAGRLHELSLIQDAWTRYAQCPGVSSDHAVEAELLGLRLSDVFAEESYAESMQIYTVNDLPGLLAQAATDPRMERVDDRDLQPISARRDETPLALLFAGVPLSPTRAAEEAADGAGAQDSHVIGLALFGKRTDRPAQMLVGAIQLPAVTRRLQEVLDTYPQIDPQPIESRVLGKQAKFLADFSAERLLGLKRADQDMAARKDCRHEVEYLLQNLPAYQTPLLGGHAFAEAAQLPQWQRRVEALLLDLESHFSQTLDIRPTIAELRQRLGLPSRGLINPKSVRLPELSLEQFSRLDFAQMPAKMLAWATNIALTYANINGLRSLLAEIERRIAAADPEILNLPLAKLYLFLGKIEGLPERGSACLLEAEKYFPEDLHERCDLLVRAIEVSAGRRLHEPLLRYFALLTDLAVRDDYCFAAYVKISGALGLELPDPVANVPTHAPRSGPQVLGRAVRSPAAISVAGAAETSADSGPAAPTGESKLWLPGM